MKKKLRTIFSVLIFAFAAISPVTLHSKGWESVKSDRIEGKTVAKEQDIEIRASQGYILITVSRQTHVKVFSILGHLISSETLPPGTSRLPVATHGVYIIKTDDLTCKVAV
ncbi:MAG: hypothetical protein HDS80_05180 [Bacteroidales bacterium]|nr:hypothetical protein [Bacteroidales bacterium]